MVQSQTAFWPTHTSLPLSVQSQNSSEFTWTREVLLFVSVHEESFIKDLQPTRALSAVTLLRWSHFVLVRWACNWPQPPTRQLISLLSLSYFRFISDHISVPLMSVHFTLSFFLCEAGVNLRNAKWILSPHLPLIHSAALKTLKNPWDGAFVLCDTCSSVFTFLQAWLSHTHNMAERTFILKRH